MVDHPACLQSQYHQKVSSFVLHLGKLEHPNRPKWKRPQLPSRLDVFRQSISSGSPRFCQEKQEQRLSLPCWCSWKGQPGNLLDRHRNQVHPTSLGKLRPSYLKNRKWSFQHELGLSKLRCESLPIYNKRNFPWVLGEILMEIGQTHDDGASNWNGDPFIPNRNSLRSPPVAVHQRDVPAEVRRCLHRSIQQRHNSLLWRKWEPSAIL